MTHSTRLRGLIRLNSQVNPETGCWDWQGQIANSGHGRLMVSDPAGQRMLSAEHASFIAHRHPLPEGARVRQTCDNRLCVNPEHLVAELDQAPPGETLQ
jgi:hypothetical protein